MSLQRIDVYQKAEPLYTERGFMNKLVKRDHLEPNAVRVADQNILIRFNHRIGNKSFWHAIRLMECGLI